MQVVAIVLLGLLVCASHVFIGYTAYRLGLSTEKLRWLKKVDEFNKLDDRYSYDSSWFSLRNWILAGFLEPDEVKT